MSLSDEKKLENNNSRESNFNMNNFIERGNIENKTRKKIIKKNITFSKGLIIFIILILIIIFITSFIVSYFYHNTSYEKSNELLLYINSDSLLRKNPVSTSDIITVLVKGTKVQYLNETKEDINGTKYNKVKLIKNDLYNKEYIGYINNEQLSNKMIKEENNLISLESKNKIVKEALFWLNSNNQYLRQREARKSGFFNQTINNIYYFDCSSFCSTILNKVFNFTPTYRKEKRIKVWITKDYLKDIKKSNSIFKTIESINKEGQKLDLNKLQIGDFILGKADKINDGINHIMLYIGEKYIIHSTGNFYYDNNKKVIRNGIFMQKLNNSNYYTELETNENIIKGNITKRFDSEIYIIRYKENI